MATEQQAPPSPAMLAPMFRRRLAPSEQGDLDTLEAAERIAGDVLASRGAPLSEAHLKAIADIAAEVAPEQIDATDRMLDAIDDRLRELFEAEQAEQASVMWCASDAASDRWTPEVTAAYYLGLAIGVRLLGREAR